MSVNIQTGRGNQDTAKFDNVDASPNEGSQDSTISVDSVEALGDQAPQPPEQSAEENLAPNPMLRFGAAEFMSSGGVIDFGNGSELSTEHALEPSLPTVDPVQINLVPVEGQSKPVIAAHSVQSESQPQPRLVTPENTTKTIPEQWAVSSAPRESNAIAAAVAYGKEYAYSDEMIEKLAALLHYEELQPAEYRTDWLSEDETSLINMVDAIKQNADGTYDVMGARELFQFYHQYDPGNMDYDAAAGMWATNGAGVERLLDFEIAQAADPVQYMFSLIAPNSMASMRYENHHWSPEQIYDQIDDYRARYDAAVAAGDVDAQQLAAGDLDVFLRSINPYLSSAARHAHIQLMFGNTGTNPDRYSFGGVQSSTHLATAFDDDGNLMPGTVDLSLPLEQQQQQLAAHLQQQGWSASNAAQFATEYYSPRIQARDDGDFNDYFVHTESKPVMVAGLGTAPVDLRSADAIVDEIEINIANGGYRSRESIQGSIDAAYDAFLRLAQRLDKDPSAVSTADEERQAQRLLQTVRTLGEQARNRGIELEPAYAQMVRGLQSSAASEAAWGVYGNGGGGNGYLSARQATRARQPLDPAQLERLSARYAELVNSNSQWKWEADIGQLTRPQKEAIRQSAIDRGLIPNVPTKPGTSYPDFNAVPNLVRSVQTLPQSMWGLRDRAQFSYLDNLIGGRPAGYTWHHSEINGRMELVPFGVHNAYGHDGGRAPGMWAYRLGGR